MHFLLPQSRWDRQGCASPATSRHRAPQLGASWVTTPAQAPTCATGRGEPKQGDSSAQPSPATGLHVPTETAVLMVWDVPWSPHPLLLCEGRSGREVPQHPQRVHSWATTGAEKALYGHWQKQAAFCTAAFQFADIHWLRLWRRGSDFFGSLRMKAPD